MERTRMWLSEAVYFYLCRGLPSVHGMWLIPECRQGYRYFLSVRMVCSFLKQVTGTLLLSRNGNMASWTSLWVAKQYFSYFVLLAPGIVFAYERTVLNLNMCHPKELVLSPNKINNFSEIWREGKFIHKIMTVNCDSATYIWVLKTAVKFPTVT